MKKYKENVILLINIIKARYLPLLDPKQKTFVEVRPGSESHGHEVKQTAVSVGNTPVYNAALQWVFSPTQYQTLKQANSAIKLQLFSEQKKVLGHFILHTRSISFANTTAQWCELLTSGTSAHPELYIQASFLKDKENGGVLPDKQVSAVSQEHEKPFVEMLITIGEGSEHFRLLFSLTHCSFPGLMGTVYFHFVLFDYPIKTPSVKCGGPFSLSTAFNILGAATDLDAYFSALEPVVLYLCIENEPLAFAHIDITSISKEKHISGMYPLKKMDKSRSGGNVDHLPDLGSLSLTFSLSQVDSFPELPEKSPPLEPFHELSAGELSIDDDHTQPQPQHSFTPKKSLPNIVNRFFRASIKLHSAQFSQPLHTLAQHLHILAPSLHSRYSHTFFEYGRPLLSGPFIISGPSNLSSSLTSTFPLELGFRSFTFDTSWGSVQSEFSTPLLVDFFLRDSKRRRDDYFIGTASIDLDSVLKTPLEESRGVARYARDWYVPIFKNIKTKKKQIGSLRIMVALEDLGKSDVGETNSDNDSKPVEMKPQKHQQSQPENPTPQLKQTSTTQHQHQHQHFEEWKQMEKIRFEQELKEKEENLLHKLESEFREHEKQRKATLLEQEEKIMSMQEKLRKGLHDLQKKKQALLLDEERVHHQIEAIHLECEHKINESEILVRRLREDFDHKKKLLAEQLAASNKIKEANSETIVSLRNQLKIGEERSAQRLKQLEDRYNKRIQALEASEMQHTVDGEKKYTVLEAEFARYRKEHDNTPQAALKTQLAILKKEKEMAESESRKTSQECARLREKLLQAYQEIGNIKREQTELVQVELERLKTKELLDHEKTVIYRENDEIASIKNALQELRQTTAAALLKSDTDVEKRKKKHRKKKKREKEPESKIEPESKLEPELSQVGMKLDSSIQELELSDDERWNMFAKEMGHTTMQDDTLYHEIILGKPKKIQQPYDTQLLTDLINERNELLQSGMYDPSSPLLQDLENEIKLLQKKNLNSIV